MVIKGSKGIEDYRWSTPSGSRGQIGRHLFRGLKPPAIHGAPFQGEDGEAALHKDIRTPTVSSVGKSQHEVRGILKVWAMRLR